MCAFVRRGPARLLLLAALVVGLGAAGCGGSTATITGTVTYKGMKLKGGSVVFTRADGQASPVSVQINEDGTYTAERVPVGETKVSVVTAYLKPQVGAGNFPKYDAPKGVESNYKPGADAGDNAKKYVKIPDKYAEPSQSGLTLTVKSGPQTYDIPLE